MTRSAIWLRRHEFTFTLVVIAIVLAMLAIAKLVPTVTDYSVGVCVGALVWLALVHVIEAKGAR